MSPDSAHININDQIVENNYLGHKIKRGKENQTAEISRRVTRGLLSVNLNSFTPVFRILCFTMCMSVDFEPPFIQMELLA